MKLPKDIEEIKQLYEILRENITEPCYRKPNMWYYALGLAGAALLGVLSTGIISYVLHNKEIEKKNYEIHQLYSDISGVKQNVLRLENDIANTDSGKKMKELTERNQALEQESEKAMAESAAEKETLEEKARIYEVSVAALKREIEEKERKHNDYIQNHPEDLTVEKKAEMGKETAGLRKQLEERVAELAILQDQIKRNDPSKEISRLTEENKRLQKETNKEQEELTKEKKANDTLRGEFEEFKKSCLENLANEASDTAKDSDQEYRERLQRDIELCTRVISSSVHPRDKTIGYLNRGNAKHRLGMYAAAIQDYDEALKLESGYVIAYNNRGNAKCMLSLFKEALADLDKALQLKPDYVFALVNRGTAKAGLNMLEDAIRDFDRAIQLKPGDAEAYRNRGNAKRALGRLEEAIQDYDAALKIKPNDPKIEFERKKAYEEVQKKNPAADIGDVSESLSKEYREKLLKDLELATKVIDSPSTGPENRAASYNNRGNIKQRLGLYKEAIEDYDESIRLRPNYASTYKNRSAAKLHLDMFEEAIQDCDTAIKLDPTRPGAYFNRGNAKLRLGRLEDAIKDYDQVLELDPDYAMAEFNRRRAYEQLKEKDPKKNPLETHLAEAERYYRTGIIKLNLKLFNEALDALNKATELKPDFADAYHARSIVKYLLSEVPGTGDPAESRPHDKLRNEAIIDINAALQLKPDDFIALNNRACLFWMLHSRLSMDNFGCGHNEYAAFIKKIMQDFDRAIDLKPDFAKGYYNRGLFKCQEFYITASDTLKVGRIEETILDFNKAIELNPNFVEAYHARGYAKDKSRSKNQFNSKYTIEEITADIEKANKLKFSKGQYDSPDFILINPEQEKK